MLAAISRKLSALSLRSAALANQGAPISIAPTTSMSSIDPVPAIVPVCEQHRLWLHVDAAYAGSAAVVQRRAPPQRPHRPQRPLVAAVGLRALHRLVVQLATRVDVGVSGVNAQVGSPRP